MIKLLISLALYLGLAIAILQNWLILAFVLLVLFSLRHGAGLFIPLAILIDGYFGNFYAVPFLSFISVWWYLVVFYIKPKLANFKIVEKYESLA